MYYDRYVPKMSIPLFSMYMSCTSTISKQTERMILGTNVNSSLI